MYVCIYMCVCVCMSIHIYREREGERNIYLIYISSYWNLDIQNNNVDIK